MSKKPKKEQAMQVNMPEGVKQLAEKTVDQAQAAFDRAGEVAHKNVQVLDASASALKSNGADFQLKVMEIAQSQVNEAFGFARKFIEAKDASELFGLQQDFVRFQADKLSRQFGELNEIAVKLARETTKPVQDTVLDTFNNFAKDFGKGFQA